MTKLAHIRRIHGRLGEECQENGILRTDVGDCWGDSNFDARIAFLCQLALEEFVQFSVEDTICNEFTALGDGSLGSSHDCSLAKFPCGQIPRDVQHKLLG